MNFNDTVVVGTTVNSEGNSRFYCFLTDRLHEMKLLDFEGKNAEDIHQMEMEKQSKYHSVIELELSNKFPKATSYSINWVIGFQTESDLKQFIKEDQVGILNKAGGNQD
ncbi:MAG: hypothetical protein CMB89_10285 [Flammeovirgaceae bacterium]|nr:hypothetical protein [Flammeovirgaceae bacterium]